MATLTEGKYSAEFLLTEANGTISREQVTIAAAAPAMVPGTLVGKITASGKYTVYSDAAADGTQVAAGVLYHGVPDSASDQRGLIIARDAEVISSLLTGSDANGLADLKALGIIAR